jgi:superfamily II DNA/RNA helicase
MGTPVTLRLVVFRSKKIVRINKGRVRAVHGDESGPDPSDLNQLHTALDRAIAAENYPLAAKIRDVLRILVDEDANTDNSVLPNDWKRLGILEWLADRVEDMGYRVPTEIQIRASPAILDGADCVIESATGSGKTLAYLLPTLSLLSYPPDLYPDDLKGTLALIVVPTRELGVQIVMLIFKLFGGSINPGIPGERANMFRYNGPRGLRVRGLLVPEEVDMARDRGYIDRCHVVVATPDLLLSALEHKVTVTSHLSVLVVDEFDACKTLFPQYMQALMKQAVLDKGIQNRPSVVLVGATIQDDLIEDAINSQWLQDPILVRVGKRMSIPSSLRHRYIVVDQPTDKIGALCRQLLADLRDGNNDQAPARVILFAESERQARVLADPLRTVLWGEHSLAVLLPGGMEPIKAMHSFRDNKASLLLATPLAARGLDLPAVSHVYNMSLPHDMADYLHRAGRTGRIGSSVQVGVITTMVTGDEEEVILQLGSQLGIELQRLAAIPPPSLENGKEGYELQDVEEAKRALEAALAISPQQNLEIDDLDLGEEDGGESE